MRVEARHPAGEWLPLSPAAPLPAPQTHYQWRWTPLNVASIDHPLTFSFSAGTLARSDELAQYGIIHDPHASSRLMIVEESEDTLALAEKVIAALTASAAGLIVVTRRAWRVEENEALSASHHALWALLRVAANEQPERLLAAIDLAENTPWETLHQGLSAVSLSQRWLAARGDTLWLPSLAPNTGCAAELPANVFTGDSRWHLVTGAFGGLGRLAVNWLREKGARRIALLAPRVDESWLRDVEGGQTRVCRCDVGDAGQLATVLDDLAANGGIAGAIHAAGVLADAPLQELDDHQLAAVFAVKRRRQASCCKPCATTTDAILFSTLPLPPPSARRVRAPMRWPAATWTGWPSSFPPLMRRKRSLSPGAHGEKAVGRPRRKCWRRSPAEVWAR